MSTNVFRRAAGLLAVAGIVGASLLVASPAAAREPTTQAACNRGEVCVNISGGDGPNTILRSQGDIKGPIDMRYGGSVKNNGWPEKNRDHIRFTYRHLPTGGEKKVCLHYPGDGDNSITIPRNSRITTNIVWGKDC